MYSPPSKFIPPRYHPYIPNSLLSWSGWGPAEAKHSNDSGPRPAGIPISPNVLRNPLLGQVPNPPVHRPFPRFEKRPAAFQSPLRPRDPRPAGNSPASPATPGLFGTPKRDSPKRLNLDAGPKPFCGPQRTRDHARRDQKSLVAREPWQRRFVPVTAPSPASPVTSPASASPVQVPFTALNQEVQDAVSKADLSEDDLVFIKQLEALDVDRVFRTSLGKDRETMERATIQGPETMKKQEKKRAEARKRAEVEDQERRLAAQKRKEARLKEEQARQQRLEEQRRKYEQARKEEEARRKMMEEMRRQQEIWEREKRERERKEREERTRRAAQREEEIRRWREAARQGADEAQPQRAAHIDQQFTIYDAKWAELKTNGNLPPLCFAQLPWPILDAAITSATDITYERLREFVLYPRRRVMDGKTGRERVKMEMLKWHPDKFNAKVMCKVAEWEREAVSEGAGLVARLLTRMMSEEVERENRGH